MEFQEFVRERKRMCSEMLCCECPLDTLDFRGDMCSYACLANPEKAEQIVSDWSKEHPFVSNGQKLKEVLNQTFGEDCNEIMISAKPMWANTEYKEQGGRKND